jgi:hypothetical protein
MGTMGELQMTEYSDLVQKRRLYIASEEWGNKVSMHYMCKGSGDTGFGMGYFIYYNNGAVHKILDNKAIVIVQKPNSIEDVMDDYGRAHAS